MLCHNWHFSHYEQNLAYWSANNVATDPLVSKWQGSCASKHAWPWPWTPHYQPWLWWAVCSDGAVTAWHSVRKAYLINLDAPKKSPQPRTDVHWGMEVLRSAGHYFPYSLVRFDGPWVRQRAVSPGPVVTEERCGWWRGTARRWTPVSPSLQLCRFQFMHQSAHVWRQLAY